MRVRHSQTTNLIPAFCMKGLSRFKKVTNWEKTMILRFGSCDLICLIVSMSCLIFVEKVRPSNVLMSPSHETQKRRLPLACLTSSKLIRQTQHFFLARPSPPRADVSASRSSSSSSGTASSLASGAFGTAVLRPSASLFSSELATVGERVAIRTRHRSAVYAELTDMRVETRLPHA